MSLTRWLRHVGTSAWTVKRRFTPEVLAAIEAAVAEAERQHGGELRWAIEGSLDGQQLWSGATPRERALAAFANLGMWDTAANNGVLIYVLVADQAVEIVADRGYGAVDSDPAWQAACDLIDAHFASGDFLGGVTAGTAAVGRLMAACYPAVDRNEQPNSPVLL